MSQVVVTQLSSDMKTAGQTNPPFDSRFYKDPRYNATLPRWFLGGLYQQLPLAGQ